MEKMLAFLLLLLPTLAWAGPLLPTLREARPFSAEEVAYILPILLLVIGLFLLLDYWLMRKGKKS